LIVIDDKLYSETIFTDAIAVRRGGSLITLWQRSVEEVDQRNTEFGCVPMGLEIAIKSESDLTFWKSFVRKLKFGE
jgi:hypothetical protein